jgi:hypothetical protein
MGDSFQVRQDAADVIQICHQRLAVVNGAGSGGFPGRWACKARLQSATKGFVHGFFQPQSMTATVRFQHRLHIRIEGECGPHDIKS